MPLLEPAANEYSPNLEKKSLPDANTREYFSFFV